MNEKVLSVMVALPVLAMGMSQNWSISSGTKTHNNQAIIPIEKIARLRPPSSTRLVQFKVAARDEQTQKCRWTGTCGDN